jgi:hypothetical protein
LEFGIFFIVISKSYSFLSSSFLSAGWSSLEAFLNSLIPLPKPLINYGIFLPPKSKNKTTTIKMTCGTPIIPKNINNAFIISVEFIRQRY